MDAARLPEVFNFEGLTVRYFPAGRATEQLSQSERRSIPAIVRRLFSTASRYAVEETNCLICEEPKGGALIAVETDGNQDIGCVCGVCVGLSAPITRAA